MFPKFGKKSIVYFPDITDVFVKPENSYQSKFFPLVTIPLRLIQSNWKGSVHLVYTNADPYNMEAKKYYDDYSKIEQIGFSWSKGKYQFLSDMRYFDVSKDWVHWLDKTKEEYQNSKNEFGISGNKAVFKSLKIGGTPNWTQDDRTPYLENEPMIFIAQISTSDVINDLCGSELYLFYSKKHKMVVQVCQVD